MFASWVTHARPSRRQHRTQDGAAAVEFGLIAPVLILLVFGIMSFGILFAQTLALSNAARQGARLGAVGNRTCAELVAETKNSATSININTANITVQILRGPAVGTATDITAAAPCNNATPHNTPCHDSDDGDNVYVKASYKSSMLVPLFFVSDNFTVGGTGAFRCEYQ